MSPTTPAAGTPGAALTAAAGALSVPGHALRVAVGQEVAARVLAVAGGVADLAIAGGRMSARTDLPLQPGQTLRLVVSTADAESVTLRTAPATTTVPNADTAGRSAPLVTTLRAAGLTAATATAVLAALTEAGAPLPTGEAAARLGARAAQAGVAGRSQAAAFVRLDMAGLPTTPATVAGLAALADGPAVGRALAALIDAARATAPASATPSVPAPPASAATGATHPQAPPPAAAPSPAAAQPAPSAPPASAPGGGASPAPAALPTGAAAATGEPAAVAATLAGMVERITRDAVSGDVAALQAAVADLGTGLEARLARGDVPRDMPVRALLAALASHPATEPSLARAAAGLADAIGAQPLAASAGGPTPAAPTATGGAYFQLPLPGAGTVEVRIDPDASGGDGGSAPGPRKVAFLLDLSALGSVMVTATAGAGPVDARVRAADEGARVFLAHNVSELAATLGTDGAPARVQVEALARATPDRLIAPPPITGLDRRA